jgi:predicted small metal-binding protein
MAKILACRDVGFDCDAICLGITEEEILKQAGEHAKLVHGINDLTDDIVDKVRGAIREE